MSKNKYIETPERLLEYWDEYVKITKEHPILVQDYVGKDAEMVYRTKERPLTQQGFEVWMYKNHKITVGQYFDNQGKRYDDYIAICSHIVRERQADQIEGGMAGIYNPSITQRLNGLTERTENTIISEQPLFPD